MALKMSSLSTEYVRVAVEVTKDGLLYNPTLDSVQMAFTASGIAPVSGDWKVGSWEVAGTTYWARCLVGPSGAVSLSAGIYDVWVKIMDAPEIPVRKAGSVTIT